MAEIALGHGRVALVDDGDVSFLGAYTWHYHHGGYAETSIDRGHHIQMHRLLLNPPSGLIVDHINHNKLDNRRCNLRLATAAQNQHNNRGRVHAHSRFKGVHWHGINRKWTACITVSGIHHHLGSFVMEQDAARAYNEAAVRLHGEFALLNEV